MQWMATVKRYSIAIAATAAATGLELALWPWIAPSLSPMFTAAVVVTAMFAGLGPALFATTLSFVVSAFFMLPPTYSFGIGGDDMHRLIVFVGVAILVSSVAASKRQAEMNAQQALREAERANRAKDDFLALVSHELRNPLSPVMMASSMIASDSSLPALVREDADMICRNVEIQVRLIDDLLDCCRIQSGKLQLQRELLRFQQVLADAVAMSRDQANGKRVAIELTLPPAKELPEAILGDRARLCQVFSNLVRNAVKFTPDGGQINVRCQYANGWIRTEVTDTGIGISPEVLPRLFNAFEQGGNHVTKRFGGLGLGLWIAQGIVEGHGGKIYASSDGHNSGATFTVELPVMSHDESELGSDARRATRREERSAVQSGRGDASRGERTAKPHTPADPAGWPSQSVLDWVGCDSNEMPHPARSIVR